LGSTLIENEIENGKLEMEKKDGITKDCYNFVGKNNKW
jgi:hypothetical protein